MSYKLINVYDCRCEKCDHQWQTRSLVVPRLCPKCKKVTWNDGPKKSAPVIEPVEAGITWDEADREAADIIAKTTERLSKPKKAAQVQPVHPEYSILAHDPLWRFVNKAKSLGSSEREKFYEHKHTKQRIDCPADYEESSK